MAPIGAEHFTAEDGRLMTGEASQHPAYHILISARDMARFGLLMLRGGKWGERQVVSADWVAESTRDYSDASLYGADGYGYMWWVAKQGRKFPHIPHVELGEGAYSARGSRGHYLLVMPAHDMVIVHRVNTFERGNAVSGAAMGLLTAAVLNAKSAEGPILSSPTTEALDEYVGIYWHRPGRDRDGDLAAVRHGPHVSQQAESRDVGTGVYADFNHRISRRLVQRSHAFDRYIHVLALSRAAFYRSADYSSSQRLG